MRSFANRVRQRRRLETLVFVLAGLAGLAMGGTGSRAFTNPAHVSPLYQPLPESQRVHEVVRAHVARQQRQVVVLAPARPAPPPRLRPFTPPPPLAAGAPPARPPRVRGPPPLSPV